MSPSQPSPKVSRRDFLKISAAVGVTAAGVHLLDTYVPWLDYDQQVATTAPPLAEEAVMPEQLSVQEVGSWWARGAQTRPEQSRKIDVIGVKSR